MFYNSRDTKLFRKKVNILLGYFQKETSHAPFAKPILTPEYRRCGGLAKGRGVFLAKGLG